MKTLLKKLLSTPIGSISLFLTVVLFVQLSTSFAGGIVGGKAQALFAITSSLGASMIVALFATGLSSYYVVYRCKGVKEYLVPSFTTFLFLVVGLFIGITRNPVSVDLKIWIMLTPGFVGVLAAMVLAFIGPESTQRPSSAPSYRL